MGKLIRMDLYRMVRARSFLVCLALTFLLAVADAPLAKLLFTLARTLSPDLNETFAEKVDLSSIIGSPFPMMGMMLIMISLCYFFYADVENGYIKNIAGQMPMKGFTVLSKFLSAGLHNVVFAVTGIVGNLIGSLIVRQIVPDPAVADSFRVLVLKLLLLWSLCAVLVLVVSTFRSKSLGMILAVLFGLGLTPLIYLGINEALAQVFGKGFDISKYMPDTVMGEKPLDTVKAIVVSAVATGIFLPLAIRVFDRKDVK